jgi:SAM-dependent methyltransferase
MDSIVLANLTDIAHLLRRPDCLDVPILLDDKVAGDHAESELSGGSLPRIHGQPILINFETSVARPEDFTGDFRPLLVRKKHSLLRRIVKSLYVSTATSARNYGRVAAEVKARIARPVVLIVGGGTRGEGAELLYDDPELVVVSFDIYPSHNTLFVADAHAMPLVSNCVDLVCIQAVLEHVVDPVQVVSEIARVLKPGGFVYAETPFLQHVHEGPYDFWRFSESGHRLLFRDFEAIDRGTLGGPGLSLYWAVRQFWRALMRSKTLGNMLAAPALAFVLLDRIIPERLRIDGANGSFFFGIKFSGNPRPQLHPADIYLG